VNGSAVVKPMSANPSSSAFSVISRLVGILMPPQFIQENMYQISIFISSGMH
jgi:hypothetical protein